MTEPTDACAALSASAAEPLAGTAPRPRSWVVLEHPGPYGRDALDCLPTELAAGVAELKARLGLGVLLARGAAASGGDAPGRPARVWLATAGAEHYEAVEVPSLDAVLAWDLSPLAEGHLPGLGERRSEPLLLVCTNGRRDLCCGRRGRAALAGADDPALLACSHLGGHRFAATALLLPSCYALGRLGAGDAERMLAAARAGRLLLELVRGRCGSSPAAQVAELAVREAAADDMVAPGPQVDAGATGPWIPVLDAAGDRWEVTLSETAVPAAPESCAGTAAVRAAVVATAALRV